MWKKYKTVTMLKEKTPEGGRHSGAEIVETTFVFPTLHCCCVFQPANTCLRMRSHGRKRAKSFKNE